MHTRGIAFLAWLVRFAVLSESVRLMSPQRFALIKEAITLPSQVAIGASGAIYQGRVDGMCSWSWECNGNGSLAPCGLFTFVHRRDAF